MTATLASLPQQFKSTNSHLPGSVPSPLKMKTTVSHPSTNGKVTPVSTEPFYRVDTGAIKTKLVEQLGDDFWAYWMELKEFLVGRLRKDEFESLVGPYLDNDVKRSLHNQLLLALLHNASSSRPIHDTPTLTPSQARKHPRSESDIDDHEVFVRPKSRVQKWVLGMSKSARETLKNELVGYDAEPESGGKQLSEMVRGWQGRRPKAAAGRHLFGATQDLTAPQCSSLGVLPTAEELQTTLDAIAREYGLPQGAGEKTGEFLVLALETHLENLMHAAVQLKAHDRPPPSSSITTALPDTTDPLSLPSHFNQPLSSTQLQASSSTNPQSSHLDLTLSDMHGLLDLEPHIHPHAGSAVYKLRNGVMETEEDEERVAMMLIAQRKERWDEAKKERQAKGGKVDGVVNGANGHGANGDAMDLDGKEGEKVSRGTSPLPNSANESTAGDNAIKLEPRTEDDEPATFANHILSELERKGLLKIQDGTEKKRPTAVEAAGTAAPGKPVVGTPVTAPPVKEKKKEDSQTHWQYIDPSEILRDILG